MNRLTKHLCVVSFDGLGTSDFPFISELPHFKELLNRASYCARVYSVYPTLTYPAHTTIITGRLPRDHGIVDNTLLQPERESPDWYWYREHIQGPTLYDLAIDRGMTVAALMWPVTAKARIQYNLPEIFANRPWQNQLVVSLLNGSPWYQLALALKYGYVFFKCLPKMELQPHLDDFTHKSLLYTLKRKRPDLTLVHYTDLDSMRHYHGVDSPEARAALRRHDARLGEIVATLKAAGMYEDTTLVVLGDHYSLDEDTGICLNALLCKHGYIRLDDRGRIKDYTAIAKSCGGSAYIYLKAGNTRRGRESPGIGSEPVYSGDAALEAVVRELRELLEDFNRQYGCLETIYTGDEARELGADPGCCLMVEAAKGYYFLDIVGEEPVIPIEEEQVGKVPHFTLATHGYSPYKENYTTVFIASGKGIKPGIVLEEMQLLDEGPTLAKLLGFELKQSEGRVLAEILDESSKS